MGREITVEDFDKEFKNMEQKFYKEMLDEGKLTEDVIYSYKSGAIQMWNLFIELKNQL